MASDRSAPLPLTLAKPLPNARSTEGIGAGRVLTFLLVLPAAVLLLTPFGLVAAAAAERPDMLLVLADKPLAVLQLAAGLVVSLLFCALPFSRIAARRARTAAQPARPAEDGQNAAGGSVSDQGRQVLAA